MKISTRISIVFSILSSTVIIFFGVVLYQLEKYHSFSDFSRILKQRVNTTEQFFLEKSKYSESEFEKIKNQFTKKLPKEIEEVIDLSNNEQIKKLNHYPDDIKQEILNQNTFSFRNKNLQGESKKININGKEYLIIVTAFDEYGHQNLAFLLKIIILLIVFLIPIIFIFVFAYSKKILLPIHKKIIKANRIGASNLNERLRVLNPKDELGQLAIAFNQLLDRIEESFKTQKSFISNASHEIKNPLTAIMGEAEIALSKKRDVKDYVESLEIILQEAERLNLTVNNLLQLSKINAYKGRINFSKINAQTFIKSIIKGYRFINPNSKIKLINHIDNDIYLLINENLLKTAIINLIDNACKFSNNQPVKIEIGIENDFFIIKIIDIGIGIPESEINQITQPFYRASNTLSIQGSGIGMALTSKIIKIHNGKISIHSKVNIKTTITCFIPLHN